MFKQLVVPLDGSEYSQRALGYARGLAEATGAKVSLLTVILRYPSPDLPHVAELDEHSRQLAERYLTDMEKKLGDGASSVERQVMLGEPARCITDYAESSNADLIVMSTHGIGATGMYALGSVAMKVLMTAPCPVLMIRIGDAGATRADR